MAGRELQEGSPFLCVLLVLVSTGGFLAVSADLPLGPESLLLVLVFKGSMSNLPSAFP